MDKNTKTLISVLGGVALMVAVSFISVPAYKLFCQMTGFGGTPKISQTVPDTVLERIVMVKFDANTSPNLPWRFEPETRNMEVNIGQQALVAFIAENKAKTPTAGTAVYNVTPLKAGKYFHKTQCFCFGEQMLQPGQDMRMPVVFYIDPAMADDRNMDDVTSITLSYSFLPTESEELEAALEAFYNTQNPAIESGDHL